jgi:uncharacterized protein YdaU (DUF1376 family)
MERLGYTFYPKDFISDPDVMMMTSSQRGIYRDLIDLAYMNDNKIKYNLVQLSKYCNATETEINEVLSIKGIKDSDFWTIPSCNKRIAKAQTNRENGSKGGRPKKPKQNPTNNPTKTQTERQREREREKERELTTEGEPSTFKNLNDRKIEFGTLVKDFVGTYSDDMCKRFFNYWTESNVNGKKMRFEMEKVFDLKRRLATWAKNDKEWNKDKEPIKDKLVENVHKAAGI